jgi:hypothetical protein
VKRHRNISVVSTIVRRVLRGIALVLFGGILLLASLMTSANWNGVPLDKMFSGEAQDQPTNSD